MTLIARFAVDRAEPKSIEGFTADRVGVMVFTKTLSSGLLGSAQTLFTAAGTEEGSRSYVATERITGRTGDGRSGSFTVQHGAARIQHDSEGAYFEIELVAQP